MVCLVYVGYSHLRRLAAHGMSNTSATVAVTVQQLLRGVESTDIAQCSVPCRTSCKVGCHAVHPSRSVIRWCKVGCHAVHPSRSVKNVVQGGLPYGPPVQICENVLSGRIVRAQRCEQSVLSSMCLDCCVAGWKGFVVLCCGLEMWACMHVLLLSLLTTALQGVMADLITPW
jgi:hypothetical protein